MLKPEDVESKAFNRSVMGYNVNEVDHFLDEIVLALREIYGELDKLRQQLKKVNEEKAEMEKRVGEVEEAKAKIIEEAKVAAKEIIEAAITKAKELTGEA